MHYVVRQYVSRWRGEGQPKINLSLTGDFAEIMQWIDAQGIDAFLSEYDDRKISCWLYNDDDAVRVKLRWF